ncbi:hypothetical protein PIROE2DRAFT_1099 [Piromyces sp. E2]|nr:hypothetical protein PIROE2DRAFT_1099 [Piromyces sp. E2]|eukprot:OUM70581.1 hypothetical protein PIROE2DRAFT_1099 [Piromyces sp. E2]
MVKFSFRNSVKNTLLFVSTFLALNANTNAYSYTKNASKFTDKELQNPYIGWFHGAVTIDLNDYPKYDCNYLSTFSHVRHLKKTGLQYLGVRLAEFYDREISNTALTALRNLLEEYRKKRKEDPTLQIILRFYYDSNANYKSNSDHEPKSSKRSYRKRSTTTSDANSEYPKFKQEDNGEISLTYDDYEYFKQEYNTNVLNENDNNNGTSAVGIEEDQGNVVDKKEESPKVEYLNSKGKLQTIVLNDENQTIDDLKLTREDKKKLKDNEKFNNEKYYNEYNELSLSEKEFEVYEKNAILINDQDINNIINGNFEKRGSKEYEEEFYKDASKSMYKNTRLIAKELYQVSLNSVKKTCIRNFKGNKSYKKYETTEIEPRSLDVIINHIVQLSDIVNEYKDLIYIYQGAFVGAYGEMWGSNYLDSDNLSKIINTIDELFDPSIFLSVRRPSYYRDLDKTFKSNKNSYFNFDYQSFSKRMSLYNDGLFYQASDYGTYRDKSREEEVAFQKELCLKVPNGGEGCFYDGNKSSEAKYNEFNYADEHARNIHLSYLNDEYSDKLLGKWENVKGSAITKRYPNWNVNARDCIGRHLGYRYVIENSSISNNQYLNIDIKNVGYSPSYLNFDVKLYLVEKTNQSQVISGNVTNDDTRTWINDKIVTLQFNLNSVKNQFKYKTYDVFIRVVDKKTNYAIKFGIDNKENDKYGYRIGSLTV